MSRAGVDAYTVQVGKALCWNLELSAKVQDNLVEEIKNLKCAKVCDNLLWFGFGIKQIVADLADTEQGLALMALCSALTTNYDVFYAAQILRQLCLQAKAPQNFIPSLQQWKALVRLCSGILMDSPFQLLLNGLQRLVRGSKPIIGQEAMEPASIAKGLSNLVLLSKGSIIRLSFSGGEDCCWLAAFAKWVLSLDVAIYDAIGSLVYLSQDQRSEAPQVIFNLDVKASNTILLAQKTSLVPRGQSLIKLEARDGSASNLSSLSTWATILHDTFGSAVDMLLGDPCGLDFAVFFCDMPALDWLIEIGFKSVPKIQDRAAENEPRPPPDSGCMESLMHSARKLLPELSLLQPQACWQKRKRDRALDESLTNITVRCCTDNNQVSERQRPFARDCHADPCLVGLAHTICAYLRVLLILNIGDHVVPSIRGLRRLYESRRFKSLNQHYLIPQRLYNSVQEVYEVLTGDFTHSGSPEPSALVRNGLCIFSCFLVDPMGPLHETRRFSAVRGYISYEDGWYESLVDMDTGQYNRRDDQDKWSHVVTKSRAITAQPVVQETDNERSLGLAYKTRFSQLHVEKQPYWLRLDDLASRLRKVDIQRLRPCPGRHGTHYTIDKNVRYAVEEELSRWARKEGFVLRYYKSSSSEVNRTTGMRGGLSLFIGEGPALCYTSCYYDGIDGHESLFRCPECLDCLLDWSDEERKRFCVNPYKNDEVHLHGLTETPFTVRWEPGISISPSPSTKSESTRPIRSDGSNSPLHESDS